MCGLVIAVLGSLVLGNVRVVRDEYEAVAVESSGELVRTAEDHSARKIQDTGNALQVGETNTSAIELKPFFMDVIDMDSRVDMAQEDKLERWLVKSKCATGPAEFVLWATETDYDPLFATYHTMQVFKGDQHFRQVFDGYPQRDFEAYSPTGPRQAQLVTEAFAVEDTLAGQRPGDPKFYERNGDAFFAARKGLIPQIIVFMYNVINKFNKASLFHGNLLTENIIVDRYVEECGWKEKSCRMVVGGLGKVCNTGGHKSHRGFRGCGIVSTGNMRNKPPESLLGSDVGLAYMLWSFGIMLWELHFESPYMIKYTGVEDLERFEESLGLLQTINEGKWFHEFLKQGYVGDGVWKKIVFGISFEVARREGVVIEPPVDALADVMSMLLHEDEEIRERYFWDGDLEKAIQAYLATNNGVLRPGKMPTKPACFDNVQLCRKWRDSVINCGVPEGFPSHTECAKKDSCLACVLPVKQPHWNCYASAELVQFDGPTRQAQVTNGVTYYRFKWWGDNAKWSPTSNTQLIGLTHEWNRGDADHQGDPKMGFDFETCERTSKNVLWGRCKHLDVACIDFETKCEPKVPPKELVGDGSVPFCQFDETVQNAWFMLTCLPNVVHCPSGMLEKVI